MNAEIAAKEIPERLIYEMDEGKPVFYKGYKDVLAGKKEIGEIMGDSSIQAWLKSRISTILNNLLSKEWVVTAGEQGLYLGKHSWRSSDIAVFKKGNFSLDNRYARKAPEIVFEIDTKADLEGSGKASEYFERKVDQLLEFGVKKIIWIFTDNESTKIFEPDKEPATLGWEEDIYVFESLHLNIRQIIESFYGD